MPHSQPFPPGTAPTGAQGPPQPGPPQQGMPQGPPPQPGQPQPPYGGAPPVSQAYPGYPPSRRPPPPKLDPTTQIPARLQAVPATLTPGEAPFPLPIPDQHQQLIPRGTSNTEPSDGYSLSPRSLCFFL
ncbi:hypothetical protein MTO96_031609 [Rhipicephalus appendiculatus]